VKAIVAKAGVKGRALRPSAVCTGTVRVEQGHKGGKPGRVLRIKWDSAFQKAGRWGYFKQKREKTA